MVTQGLEQIQLDSNRNRDYFLIKCNKSSNYYEVISQMFFLLSLELIFRGLQNQSSSRA